MHERRGETSCSSSSDEVETLSECFLFPSYHDMKTQSEKENKYVHTPSQRVQKSIQSVPYISPKR